MSSDCVLVFRGRAADTIAALGELYDLGDWGRKRVIAALSEITSLPEPQQIALH